MISGDIAPDGGTPWRPEIAEVVGQFVDASNVTLLGRTDDGVEVIYKPIAGERPLHDFTRGTLAVREVLTYELSQVMGLGVVPETVIAGGPYGNGSAQRRIQVDESYDPLDAARRGDATLWPLAVLDVLANNADRKLGHVLREAETGRLVGVDHGLTFHPDDKLRTVLWSFAGQRIPDDLMEALHRVVAAMNGAFGERVTTDLGREAREGLARRTSELIEKGRHPDPPEDRHPLPWPLY